MKNFADILVQEDKSRKNYADVLYAEDNIGNFQNTIQNLNGSTDVNAYKSVLTELPRYKGFIDDKAYNQLSDYLSSSIKQISDAQALAKKRSDAVNGFKTSVDNALKADAVTSKDLLELLQTQQNGNEIVDDETVDKVKKNLLGESTGNYKTDNMAFLKSLRANAEENGDQKGVETWDKAIKLKQLEIDKSKAKQLSEYYEMPVLDRRLKMFDEAFESSTNQTGVSGLDHSASDEFKKDFGAVPVPYLKMQEIRSKIKNGETLTETELKWALSGYCDNLYFDNKITLTKDDYYNLHKNHQKTFNENKLLQFSFDNYIKTTTDTKAYANNGLILAEVYAKSESAGLELKALAADDFDKYANLGSSDEATEFMTATQKGVYNYYLGKGDEQSAYAYKRGIQEDINYREAKELAENAGFFTKTGVSFASGFEKFGQGLIGFVDMMTDNGIGVKAPQSHELKVALSTDSVISLATAEIIAGSGTWGKVWYSSMQSIGQQAPMFALSLANPAMGLSSSTMQLLQGSMMFASSSGASYTDALKENKAENEAAVYAVINGALEVGLEKALGSMYGWSGGSKVATKLLSKMQNTLVNKGLSKVTMALLGTATYKISSMMSEGFEEYLQEVIDPIVRNFVYNEDNDISLFSEEAFISFASGALVSLLFGAADIKSTYRQSLTGASIRSNTDGINGLIENARNALNNPEISVEIKQEISTLLETIESKGNQATNIELGQLQELVQTGVKQADSKIVEQEFNDLKNDIVEAKEMIQNAPDLSETASIDEELQSNLINDTDTTTPGEVSNSVIETKASNTATDVSGTDSADVDFDTNIDADIDTEVNVESSSDIDTITESEIAEADYLDNETLESVEENEYDKTIRLMDGREKPLTEAQAYVQSVGRALGYTVVIDDLSHGGRTASGKSFKGTTRGFFDGQTIYLHEGQTTFDAVVEIFKHEITHYAELNPEMYNKYAKAVFDSKVFENWISGKAKGRSHPARLGQYRQSIIDIYEANGKTLDPTAADHEIIANFTSEMLFNEKGNTLERFINEVNSEDRNAISRFIHDFISWLKARLKGEKVSLKIVKLENHFAAVLRNVDNANAQKNNTTNDGDVQNLSADKSVGYYSSQEQNIERTNAGLDDSAFSMPENDDKTNHSFEITPEQDAEYQRYVESWNKESAQKMVDEKAKNMGAILDENGNPLKLYRGTTGGQTVFAKETTLNGKIYTIDNVDVASNYGDKSGKATEIAHQIKGEKSTYALYGFPKKMLTIDAQYGVWSDLVIPNELLKYADGRYKATNGEIAEWAELEGYDSLRINNVRDGSFDVGNEIIFFDENLVKSADPITYDDNGKVIPLSERFNEDDNDIRYSFEDDVVDKTSSLAERVRLGEISQTEYLNELQRLMDEATEKYGAIEKGENPKVDVTVPRQVSDKRNTRRFVRTVLESGILTDEMVADTDEAILKDALSYVPISNKESIKVAENSLKNGTAERDWNKVANGDKIPSKHDIAKGEILLKMYAENGDTLKVMELVADLSEVATRAGQTVQAFSLLKKMSGVGQLYYVQKTVDKLNRDLEKKHKGKHEQITIDETLAGQLVTAKPGTETENIVDEIMQDIAEQVPVTFLDKWNAWRYLAMLGNPRTHIRNLFGNAVFMPAIKLKDTIKAGMEKAFVSQENRTTSVIVNKEYKDFAKSDFEKVADIITGNGKMNPSDAIREQQKIFKNKVLEGFRKSNFDRLEEEDMIFLKMHYKRALGGFLQARNIDLNNIDEAILNEARNYAIEEAQKATYRDASAFANTISRFSRSNKTANLLIEGILPFKKTPINIVKRGIEYSPVGLIKTLSKGAYDLKNGNITASQFIDGISSGLTGTGVFVLGVILSNLGIAIGGLGYDDEDALKRLNGEQEYSIELFGHSYTVDWMAPVCIPFFMGVEFANTFTDNEKDIVTAFVDSAYSSLEPVINLSMLNGIRDTIAAARYSDAEDVLTQVGGETISSYFSQALPTLFGQVARTFDDTRRSNFVPGDATGFEKKLYEFFQNAMGKTPILENQKMPYTDAFGEKDTNDNFFLRVFENMLSPGYSSTIKETDVNAELADLFKQTGDGAVIPRKASKSFTVGGERIYLDADQYTQYNTKKGQLSQNMLVDLFNSKGYKSMTYTKKAEAVSEVYKYANMLAKTEVSDYELEGKYAKWKEYQGYGYDVSELIALDIADKDFDGSGGVSKSEYAEAVNNTDMSQKQKDLLIGLNEVEGKSDYSKNKTKGFGTGDWYYKENGQYVKITSAAELNRLRRNNVDTYVYTGNYTDVIDELWKAYRGY